MNLNNYRRNLFSVGFASMIGAVTCVVVYRHYFDVTWYGYALSIFIGMLVAAVIVGPMEVFGVTKESFRFVAKTWRQRIRFKHIVPEMMLLFVKEHLPVYMYSLFWGVLYTAVVLMPFDILSLVWGIPAFDSIIVSMIPIALILVIFPDKPLFMGCEKGCKYLKGAVSWLHKRCSINERVLWILPIVLWPAWVFVLILELLVLIILSGLLLFCVCLMFFAFVIAFCLFILTVVVNAFLMLATTPRMAAMIGASVGGMAGIGFDLDLIATAGIAMFVGLLAFVLRKVCDKLFGQGALIPLSKIFS